ncbi:MAG TPA: CapA family protein [Patescibacteria group bacterium]|nr:CapA family protein [Patescibacteria group bacterium]
MILIFVAAIIALTLGLFFLTAWVFNQAMEIDSLIEGKNEPAPTITGKLELEPVEIKIIAVGDMMLSRVVGQKMMAKGDYNYPFLAMTDYLKSAELAVGNLETAITPGRPIKTGEMAFRADREVAQTLKDNNFQMLSLANNHTPNFGESGLKDTFQYLTAAGITFVGAGENLEQARAPKITETGGIKIAWLSRTEQLMVPESYAAGEKRMGTAFAEEEEIVGAIKKAREQADLVVVLLHAGTEYTPQPTKKQIALAHTAIEAGAEIVIGHHPHVVQTAEKYQGKYIFYSLGNFIFDQMWSQETREGLVLKLTMTKSGVRSIEATPILIEDYCQPKILRGEEGEKVVKRLGIETEKIGDEYVLK